jgi:ABC-type branched-subunit amino acid transport system substrate-binding protein
MRGQDVVRIGVLLPFGSQDARVRAEAEGLLAAIEMALFETAGSNALILPKDVGDSAALAAEAARAALTDSVDVVIGPLRAENVRAAAGVLGPAQVPLIGFSNDRSATESGALLLSFPPEEEIDRVVDWAARQGVTGFALLGPDSPFGRRVEAALAASARLRNASLIGAEFYAPTEAARLEAARRLHAAIAAPARANPGRVAVLLPEGGVNLQGVAPLMAYTGLDRRFVRLIGTGQWSDPTAWREPGLRGGTFAGPAPGAAGDFDARFQAAFGRRPTRLATLGYDAAALAISLLREDGDVTRQDLLDPQGFVGLDGLFRFRGDGTVERGLAILQIEDGRLGVAEQPPQAFGQPAS